MKICCFSGHRPEKFINWEDEKEIIKLRLKLAIKAEILNGYTYFISGMARGVDMLCAEIVLELKKIYPIFLVCVIPFSNQSKSYSEEEKERYSKIISESHKCVTILKTYTKFCFMLRNKYMVDHSTLLIAIWNGKQSGTKNTVNYAISQGINVVIIDC